MVGGLCGPVLWSPAYLSVSQLLLQKPDLPSPLTWGARLQLRKSPNR